VEVLVVHPSVQPVEAAAVGCWLGRSSRSTTLATVDVLAGIPLQSNRWKRQSLVAASPTSPTTCDGAMKTLVFCFFVSTTFCLREFELAV
ncbi:MAG TPA: hypothetical protein VM260_14025, partial [Pirellula sp.]|nr:hypothetical protein [Pirellula sp.]